MLFTRLLILLALFHTAHLFAGPLGNAQDSWQSLETDNFRVHYPSSLSLWAKKAAAQAEKVRAFVKNEQGLYLTVKVDVYVIDPYNTSNGFAMPFSEKPYMALYATSPLSDSFATNMGSWQQSLILHEYIHLVHLAQKSRSPTKQKIRNISDSYDLKSAQQPRWISEGYATLLESTLTGQGRLYDQFIEAQLKQFARGGTLPTFEQLNGGQGYLTNDMAYYLGSRFLYWLEIQFGEGKLKHVWVRKNALKNRSFEQAFTGVFGDSPKALYQRFIAEYTFISLQEEQALAKAPRTQQSALWTTLDGIIDSPTISPDKSKLALIQRTQNNKIFLKIISTATNMHAQKTFDEHQTQLLKNDPDDIATITPVVFPRKIVNSLSQHDFQGIKHPRWFNNNIILFSALNQQTNGNKNYDLYAWNLTSGEVRQLTSKQYLRRFDISYDKKFIIAEQNKAGVSQLVKLSISTKQAQLVVSHVTLMSQHKHTGYYDFPRLSPNDNTLAYLQKNQNEKWQLKLIKLDEHNNTITQKNTYTVPMPAHYQFLSYVQWSNNAQALYFSASDNNIVKLYRYHLATQSLVELTNGLKVPVWPLELNDEQLLHVNLTDVGPRLMSRELSSPVTSVTLTTTKASYSTPQTSLATRLAHDLSLTTSLSPRQRKDQPPTTNSNSHSNSHSNAHDNRLSKTNKQKQTSNTHTSNAGTRYLPPVEAENTLDDFVINDYGIGPQALTMISSLSMNNASHYLVEIGAKQSDLLNRFKWQLTASGDFDNQVLAGFSGNIGYQSQYGFLSAHFFNIKLDALEQREASLWQNDTHKKGMVFAAKQDFIVNRINFTGLGQLNIEQQKQQQSSEKNYYLYGHLAQNWFIDRQEWGIQQSAKLGLLTGELAGDSWQGYDLNFQASAAYYWMKLGFSANSQYRNKTNLLSVGGYNSNLVSAQAHRNNILVPALAFAQVTGEKHQYLEGFIPIVTSKLFVGKHQMNGHGNINIYGLSSHNALDNLFTGINGLTLDAGIANVSSDTQNNETKFWLSSFYQW